MQAGEARMKKIISWFLPLFISACSGLQGDFANSAGGGPVGGDVSGLGIGQGMDREGTLGSQPASSDLNPCLDAAHCPRGAAIPSVGDRDTALSAPPASEEFFWMDHEVPLKCGGKRLVSKWEANPETGEIEGTVKPAGGALIFVNVGKSAYPFSPCMAEDFESEFSHELQDGLTQQWTALDAEGRFRVALTAESGDRIAVLRVKTSEKMELDADSSLSGLPDGEWLASFEFRKPQPAIPVDEAPRTRLGPPRKR